MDASMPDELNGLEKAEIKAAMKEALNEWLTRQFATFGKWTLRGAGAIAFYVLMYGYLISHGWRK